jgi:hypothetical protein
MRKPCKLKVKTLKTERSVYSECMNNLGRDMKKDKEKSTQKNEE